MVQIIDITKRLKQTEDTSIDEALELVDKILDLQQGQMMMITNVDGDLRCQVVKAHWFRTEQ